MIKDFLFLIDLCGVFLQILQTGQEIMELDTSGFATQGPTVFAGNIGNNKYIIQVSPMGIRLLEGGNSGKLTYLVIVVVHDGRETLRVCLNTYPSSEQRGLILSSSQSHQEQ